MKKILLCIMLFSIIAFSGCLEEKMDRDDFNINVEWNNDYNSPHVEPGNNHLIHDTFSLDISLLNDKIEYPIYYRVYKVPKSQYGENLELSQFDDGIYEGNVEINTLWDKNDKPSFNIYLDSIEEEPEIEVIFSTDEWINWIYIDAEDVQMLKILPKRKIDVDIEENPIKFFLSKGTLMQDFRQILIKNTGDVKLNIGIELPNNFNDPYYSSFKPQYMIRHGFSQESGTKYNMWLNPGESELFDFSVSIDRDAVSGFHQSNLIIYSLFEESSLDNKDAYYKKTFALETTVAE